MQWLVCAVVVALLVSLAWFDVAHRRLPNKLVGAVALLYFVIAALTRAPLGTIGAHIAMALLAFFVGALLFAARMLSGGDVKFAAAVFLWSGAGLAWPTFVMISLAGLVVACVALAAGWLVRRSPAGKLASFAKPWVAERGVPYGVAIALGALPMLALRTLEGGMTL